MSYYPRPDPPVEELPKTSYASETFWLIALVIVVGNFAGTLGAADQLCKIPLQNLLKNTLHVSREETARFFFLTGLFFYIKPLAGILTDAFPLFGTRRRYYLLYSSILAAVSWLALALLPKTYLSLMLGVIVINLFVVMISTVTGAFLVELGQSRGEVGRLSAVRQVARSALFTLQGPLGGLLAGMAFWIATGVGALVALSIFPIAFYYLKEKAVVGRNPAAFHNAGRQLGVMFRSWPFWMATLFIGLFNFAPGLGTMMYFRQNDVLKLSQGTIGLLGADANVAGIGAALLYFYFAKRISMRKALVIAVVTSALSVLGYLGYSSLPAAVAIDFQAGFFGGYATVAFLDLAARGTPAGCEGLGYSFMMSVMNFAGTGADWFASHMADRFHMSWSSMVFLNSGSTLLVLVLIPLMPKSMMASRDAGVPNLENTGEPEAA